MAIRKDSSQDFKQVQAYQALKHLAVQDLTYLLTLQVVESANLCKLITLLQTDTLYSQNCFAYKHLVKHSLMALDIYGSFVLQLNQKAKIRNTVGIKMQLDSHRKHSQADFNHPRKDLEDWVVLDYFQKDLADQMELDCYQRDLWDLMELDYHQKDLWDQMELVYQKDHDLKMMVQQINQINLLVFQVKLELSLVTLKMYTFVYACPNFSSIDQSSCCQLLAPKCSL